MNFANVTYDEAMRRAREIVPVLRERAQKCEDARVAAAGEREAAARDGAVPLPPAEALRRHGASVRRGGRHRLRAGARLSVDRVERRQPRLPPLDPRLLRARDAARAVGRESRRPDRLFDRAGGGARQRKRTMDSWSRPMAVLLRSRQLRLEHARGHHLRRRQCRRLAALPGAEERLQGDRHLVRDGHGRHRQQGHRGEGGLRARAPRARLAALPRRTGASRRCAEQGSRCSGFRSSLPPGIRCPRRCWGRPKALSSTC